MEKIFTARIKPYTAFQRGVYGVMVDEKGVVRVWDHLGQHYTICHDLSERTQQRLRNQVANIASQ